LSTHIAKCAFTTPQHFVTKLFYDTLPFSILPIFFTQAAATSPILAPTFSPQLQLACPESLISFDFPIADSVIKLQSFSKF
jgi:hypothetical protein